MALLLRGAPVAAAIQERAARDTAALRARGVIPGLGLLRLGARPDDIAYGRSLMKRAGDSGVEARETVLPENAATGEVLDALRALNASPAVHGILVFRPLPPGVDDAAVCAAIAPEKDLDGASPASMAALYAGRLSGGTGAEGAGEAGGLAEGFAPCTASAVIALLDHYGAALAGKRAVVIGRSTVIGRPLALLLLGRDATVTVCHSKTADLPAICREADIVTAALGKRRFLGADCFRPGQWVTDAGIHQEEGGGLSGDVDFASAEPVVQAISPVPGGAGAVTGALLVARVVRAALNRTAGAKSW